MVAARLALLFWRRGRGRQQVALALTAGGILVSVVLALLALSVRPALADRADRIAWREGAQSDATVRGVAPWARQATTTDQHGERTITRVDLAPMAEADPASGSEPAGPTRPAPPGLARFPAAGEIFASPAMAQLLGSVPVDELAGRYPGTVVGTVAAEGLAHDDELLVVVGHPAGALLEDGHPIAAFARWGHDPDLDLYQTLASTATVLLVVPTLLLVGAAARLTAAHREQRLAALRLAGATPASVVALTALEVLLSAVVGTALGIVVYLLVLPLAGRLPLAGGTFPVTDLRLGPVELGAALAVVPALAAVAAVVALRRVVVGPLGVSRRTTPRRPRAARFVVLPVAWTVFAASVLTMRAGGSSLGALSGLGAVIATLAVLGPWVTWAIGAALTRVARSPASLLAGRRISADPKGAYRTVSGMVLASLIAGFLFGVLPTLDAAQGSAQGRRELAVDVAPDRVDAVRRALAVVEPSAQVIWLTGEDAGTDLRTDPPQGPASAQDGSGPPTASRRVEALVVASTPTAVDRARTAIVRADPAAAIRSWDRDGRGRLLLADLGRASGVLALASLVLASAATAVSGCASILDQRLTLARLRLVGTPIAVLQRARRWQTLVPLVVASTGALASGASAGLGMLLAFGVGSARIQVPEVAPIVLLGVAAVAAGLAVVALTRPLLVVTSRAEPRA